MALAFWRANVERSPRRTLEGAGHAAASRPDDYLPQLNEVAVHVWTFNLKGDREAIARQEAVLSAEEWRRVRRHFSGQSARRFIVRRGLLRRILGEYLDLPPEEIRFVYNDCGKPFLAPHICPDLQFSLSDSGELGALAVGLKEPLGIDIERLRTVAAIGGTDPFGSPVQEADRCEGKVAPVHSLRFVKAWTRREAVAKAEGVGLQLNPGSSEIDYLADCMQPTSTADRAILGRGIHIHELTLPAGYVGALATSERTPIIAYFSL